MKMTFVFLFSLLATSMFAQSSLEDYLKNVEELEFPYKLGYENLDTINTENYQKITDIELAKLLNDEDNKLYEVEEGLTIDHYIIGKISYEDNVAFLLYSETEGGLMLKSMKSVVLIKYCDVAGDFTSMDFSSKLDFKKGGAQTVSGYFEDKNTLSTENGYYIYDIEKYRYDFTTKYQFKNGCYLKEQ